MGWVEKGEGSIIKCTGAQNEMAVKLIQRRALTSLPSFINILMGENVSPSSTVFFHSKSMALYTFNLQLHNKAYSWKEDSRVAKRKKVQGGKLIVKIELQRWVAERTTLRRHSLETSPLKGVTQNAGEKGIKWEWQHVFRLTEALTSST